MGGKSAPTPRGASLGFFSRHPLRLPEVAARRDVPPRSAAPRSSRSGRRVPPPRRHEICARRGGARERYLRSASARALKPTTRQHDPLILLLTNAPGFSGFFHHTPSKPARSVLPSVHQSDTSRRWHTQRWPFNGTYQTSFSLGSPTGCAAVPPLNRATVWLGQASTGEEGQHESVILSGAHECGLERARSEWQMDVRNRSMERR